MTTKPALPVLGYSDQPEAKIDLVNEAKILEEILLRQIERLENLNDIGSISIDRRWLAVAKTHIEQGFMAVNRAVFQPGRVEL